MDVSEQYVKMCDYEEIQSKRKATKETPYATSAGVGEWWFNRKSGNVYVVQSPLLWEMTLQSDVWLPRQDQIQEMLEWYEITSRIVIMYVNGNYWIEKWPEGEVIDEDSRRTMFRSHRAKSMEQLWIMLYMYERHNKTWNRKEWI